MANKMLIDATHPEETRVVVLRGNRVEEFDFESAHRKQLRGNIYLAKVTRVEPSLQAAFVDYGGNRHGFLAFSEIHPDYYQIPVADRQALLDEENRAHHDEDDNADRGSDRGRGRGRHRHKRRGAERHRGRDVVRSDNPGNEELAREAAEIPAGDTRPEDLSNQPRGETDVAQGIDIVPAQDAFAEGVSEQPVAGEAPQSGIAEAGESEFSAEGNADQAERVDHAATDGESDGTDEGRNGAEDGGEEEIVESVGGDAMEEVRDRTPRYRRQYKIQEVIKRRQVMLVQVVKEERGTKGAALTTYLSLAGRYSVLMPNTARGGGISRKVTNAEDRKKMKEVAEELEVPEGMGVILRTAGANRTKLEVKRDFEYLLRLWETVRDLTLKSTAPTLVYEEGSLVKRSIRDLYHKDIDDIVVEGEDAYREAKDFMRMLMPSHAKNVHAYKDPQPLFARYGIETQLDGMFSATVQLKSGGYIVLNQTEALVAIDVNSGRATREHSIEDTALKTNSEAAAEIARQLRLRDLAGLIVIDFIDMDENRNNRSVERKLKEALKSDRARIQVGRISHFGLMEMSRQRIRSSVLESSTETCPHCGGTGHVRSVSSVALQLLRSLEETLLKGATHNLIVRTRSDVAIYVLNNKRAHLRLLEERFRIAITITTDPTLTGIPAFAVDRGDQVMTLEQAKAIAAVRPESVLVYAEGEDDEVAEDSDAEAEGEADAEPRAAGEPQTQGEQQDARGKRRRRGRRGRGRGREEREQGLPQEAAPHATAPGDEFEGAQGGDVESTDGELEDAPGQPGQTRESREESEKRRRRRGRRGGRRNRRGREGNGDATNAPYERDGADDIAASPPQGHYDESPRDIVDTTPAPQIEQRLVEAPAPKPAEVAAGPEAPRRRSTIREPAPSFDTGGEAPRPTPPAAPPAPAPNVQSSADEADKPRRGGWWSRRG